MSLIDAIMKNSTKSGGDKGYQSISQDDTPLAVEDSPAHQQNRLDKSAIVGEFFGTALLVQIGCAANCVALYLVSDPPVCSFDSESRKNPITYSAPPLDPEAYHAESWHMASMVWMLATIIAIYVSAPVSGGHLNPAVTLAFALVRMDEFPPSWILFYWMAQLLGAMVAGIINLMLFTTVISNYEAASMGRHDSLLYSASSTFGNYWSLSDNVENAFHAALIEFFGSAVLCFGIFATTHKRTSIPPAAVPVLAGIFYGVMVGLLGPLTGGSLNPARDMGPRLVSMMAHWGRDAILDFLPYLVGPLLGGPLGAFLADKVLWF